MQGVSILQEVPSRPPARQYLVPLTVTAFLTPITWNGFACPELHMKGTGQRSTFAN